MDPIGSLAFVQVGFHTDAFTLRLHAYRVNLLPQSPLGPRCPSSRRQTGA